MSAIFALTTGVVYVRSWSGTVSGGTLAADTIKLDSTNQDVILARGAANVLALQNSTTAQLLNIYTPGMVVTSAEKGLTVLSNTAATSSVKDQMSGRITQRGTSWTGTASKTVEFFTEVLPANAATPTATWKLGYILEGVAATYPFQVTSAGAALHSNGTSALPAFAFANTPATGIYTTNSDTNMRFSINTTPILQIDTASLGLAAGTLVAWASGAVGTVGDLFLSREAAAVLQAGLDAAGVTNQMFKGPDRITSAGVGGNLTFAGGRGFDTGLGGSLIFQTAPAAGAGVAGVLATALTIDAAKLATFVGLVDSAGYKVATEAGIDATVTTGDLVGKTITFKKGIVTGYA